ncbi:MAG: tRNA 2-thiouridine(34) synthase MnmA [Anaerolineaceae bacterium]|nr:tRNA 2-thiouridine(34) synthase MnmA [Anaerolineaceae bacterium]
MDKAKQLKKVTVAMSGGVDSAVAAGLLIEAGYEVSGITMRLWRDTTINSTSEGYLDNAIALAIKLGIKLQIWDVRDLFKEEVVNRYFQNLSSGLTPNPCIVCNQLIKWGALLEHVLDEGADYLASGHYAQLIWDASTETYLLKSGFEGKDQTYVLSILPQAKLKYLMFPLAEMTKEAVRQKGEGLGISLKVAEESQDLCFFGGCSQEYFLQKNAPELLIPGKIIDAEANVLGEHKGLVLYTIGQRKGLRIAAPRPLYVIGKDMAKNTLIVGYEDALPMFALQAKDANWISGSLPEPDRLYEIKIRYKAKSVFGQVKIINTSDFIVQFEVGLRDITPGQRVVIYDGKLCLGGGEIVRAMPKENNY